MCLDWTWPYQVTLEEATAIVAEARYFADNEYWGSTAGPAPEMVVARRRGVVFEVTRQGYAVPAHQPAIVIGIGAITDVMGDLGYRTVGAYLRALSTRGSAILAPYREAVGLAADEHTGDAPR